jgi:homogentisate 1,2-dioxygenase
MMFTITDYAMKRSGKLHGRAILVSIMIFLTNLRNPEHEPKMWDNLKGQFVNHLEEINADLKAAGLPELGK